MSRLVQFGPFELDLLTADLRRDGQRSRLPEQQFKVLEMLLRARGDLVSRQEIRTRLWSNDTIVEFDRSINALVKRLRAALGDSAEDPRIIETVARRGYRLLTEVHFLEAESMPGVAGGSVDRLMAPNPRSQNLVAYKTLEELKSEPNVTRSDVSLIFGRSRRAAHIVLSTFATALLLISAAIGWRHWAHSPSPEFRQTELTSNSGDNPVTSAAISGDGNYLLYADNVSVHVKSVPTGEIRDIPHPAEFGNRHVFWEFSWFPDSARFLAVSNHKTTWLGSTMSATLRKLRDDAHTWAISPDGSRIAFSPPGEREVWIMDDAGENARRLFGAETDSSFVSVQWSPDGSRLLDLRAPANGEPSIEIRSPGTFTPTILMSDARLRDLHWLGDGRILYLLGEPGRLGYVCDYWATRLEADGAAFAGKPDQITHSDGYCMGRASSTNDGRRMVFSRYTKWNTIEVADLEPGGTRISPPRHFSELETPEWPDGWTSDSREVVFTSNRDQMWGVYRKPLAGGSATPIWTKRSPGLGIGFTTTSPDGKWIFYFRYPTATRTDWELMKSPIAGGEPSIILSESSFVDTPRCSHAPVNLCIVALKDKDEMVFTSFDAVRGRGRELGRIPTDADRTYGLSISPDGRWISTHQGTSTTFDLLEWKTGKRKTVSVGGWTTLMTMDWAPDSKGLFMSTVEPATVLLHVDLKGRATVIWEPKGTWVAFTMASPDGHHVAMQGQRGDSNAWMIQNF